MIHWLEGFELWSGAATQFDSRYLNSISDVGDFFVDIKDGRYGVGKSWQVDGVDEELHPPLISSPGSVIITGIAVRLNGVTGSDKKFLEVVDLSQDPQVALWLTTDYRIEIRRGTIPIGSTQPILQEDVWYYLEMKVDVRSDDKGWVRVRLNEQVVLEVVERTTSEQGSSVAAGIRLHVDGLSWGHIWVDDWYICDTSGGSNNDFLGDLTLEAVIPLTDAYSEWIDTPTVDDNAENVDDIITADELATVNSATVDGARDYFYHAPTLLIGGEILALEQTARMETSSGGNTTTVFVVHRDDSNEADSTNVLFLNEDFVNFYRLWEQNPIDNRDWNAQELEGLAYGKRRISET